MKRKRRWRREEEKKEQQQQHQQYLVGELWPADGKHGDEDDDQQHCRWTAGHGDVPVPRPTTQPPPGRLHVLFHVLEQRGAVEQRPTRSCTVGLVEMTLNVTAKYTQQCIVIIIVIVIIIKFLVLPLAEQKKCQCHGIINKKVIYRKQIMRQHFHHKKIDQGRAGGVVDPVKFFLTASLITLQNLITVYYLFIYLFICP